MSLVIDLALAAGAATAWFAAIAYFRLPTLFQRIHVVTCVNIAALGLIVLAAVMSDGASSRSLKCALIWLIMLPVGALLSHVTGRALHIREGERR